MLTYLLWIIVILMCFLTKGVEFTYFYMTIMIKSFGGNYYTVMFITSTLIIWCYLVQVKRYSPNIALSLMTFICLVYTFHFNALRQAISMAIVFFAIPYILKGRTLHSLFIIIVAVLFHKTAIVMLPVIFLLNYKGNYRDVIVVAFSLVAAFSSSYLIDFASSVDNRYALYSKASEGGGEGTSLFFFMLLVIFYCYKKQVEANYSDYSRLFTLYLMGVLISITSIVLSLDPSGPLRLNQYFLQSSIFMIPMLVNSISNRLEKNVVAIVLTFLCSVYFILFTSNLANLSPFNFRELF